MDSSSGQVQIEAKRSKSEVFFNKFRQHKAGPKVERNFTEKASANISSSLIATLKISRFFLVFPGRIASASVSTDCIQFRQSIHLKVISVVFLLIICVSVGQECVEFLIVGQLIGTERMLILSKSLIWTLSNALIVVAYGKLEKLQKLLKLMDTMELRMKRNGFEIWPRIIVTHLPLGVLGIIGIGTLISGVLDNNIFDDDVVRLDLDTLVTTLRCRGRQGMLPDVFVNSTIIAQLKVDSSKFWIEVIGGTVWHSARIFGQCVEIFGHVLVALTSLSTWFLVRTFVGGLKKSEGRISQDEVLEIFDKFLTLFDLVEDIMGWVVFLTCLGNVPFYAVELPIIFRIRSASRMRFILFVTLHCSITIPAALSNRSLKIIPCWFKNRALSSRKSMTSTNFPSRDPEIVYDDRCIDLVVEEVRGNEVGIRGKAFTITFSFIGQMWGLVVTYGVLLSQLLDKIEF